MKTTKFLVRITALLFALGVVATLARAADKPGPRDTTKTTREELREKLKNMTPEERRAAIQEWREKNHQPGPARERMRQRLQELDKLTPEEREARQKQIRQRLEARLAELEKKKTDGSITERENVQLERVEKILQNSDRKNPGAKRHTGRDSDKKTDSAEQPADKN